MEHCIEDEEGLLRLAKTWEKNGRHDLKTYYQKTSDTKIGEATSKSIKWRKFEHNEKRRSLSRLTILTDSLDSPCATDPDNGLKCNKRWLPAALEILRSNGISREYFSRVVKNALQYGRGKGNNVMIIGATNRGKTFLLMPLTLIYQTFMCPAQGIYNWTQALKKELVFLNDIRYEREGEKRVMPWGQFLNLLEYT